MIRTTLMFAMLLASTAAMAGQGTATSCAAGLAKDPRAIYDASVAEVAPTTDLKALLTGKTRSLAMAGTIERASARDSARAALKCLELAQKTD
jgi:hypothetical protein